MTTQPISVRVEKTKALLRRVEVTPRRVLIQRAMTDAWKALSSEDRVILYILIDRLSTIRGLGTKGATELLAALGLWMLEQGGTCQNSRNIL